MTDRQHHNAFMGLMKEMTLVALGVLMGVGICMCAAGCGSIQCDFVEAIEQSDAVIIPELRKYVEADDDLDDGDKRAIYAHLESRAKLIAREAALCAGD